MKVQLKAAISDSKDGPWREGGGRLLDFSFPLPFSCFLCSLFYSSDLTFLLGFSGLHHIILEGKKRSGFWVSPTKFPAE